MTAILIGVIWAVLGVATWAKFLELAAYISARRAQRRAERAAWDQLRREERERAEYEESRHWRWLLRDRVGIKPDRIAISFHALTDDCAVERLLSRLHPVGARPSPESE